MSNFRFRDKVVLVTGSSTGIGRATALAFAREGAKVVVNCHASVARGRRVAVEIRRLGGSALFVPCDVANEKEVSRMARAVEKEFGGIDILVNNAGFAKQRSFFELSVADFEKTLAVNLIGAFLCARYVAPAMMKKKRGAIVNVASIRGLSNCARKDIIDYSAAKAGVINLTVSLAKELTPFGIRVNAVAPGITNTDLVKHLTREAKERAVAGTLLKRMAEPEEIASAILFLASDEARYITGEVLVADAGYRLTAL